MITICYCGRSDRHDKGPECEKPRVRLHDFDPVTNHCHRCHVPRSAVADDMVVAQCGAQPVNGGSKHGTD